MGLKVDLNDMEKLKFFNLQGLEIRLHNQSLQVKNKGMIVLSVVSIERAKVST
jgi:hypothetical protein